MSLSLILEDNNLELTLEISITEDSNILILGKQESNVYVNEITLKEITETNKYLDLIVKGNAENFLKLLEKCTNKKNYLTEELEEHILKITFKHYIIFLDSEEEITFGFILKQKINRSECNPNCLLEIQGLKTLVKDYKQQVDENTKNYQITIEELNKKIEQLSINIKSTNTSLMKLITPTKILFEEGEIVFNNNKFLYTIKSKTPLNQSEGVFELNFYMHDKGKPYSEFYVGFTLNKSVDDVKEKNYFFHFYQGYTSSSIKCGLNGLVYPYKIQLLNVMTVRIDLNNNFLHFFDADFGPITLMMNNLTSNDKCQLTPYIQYDVRDKFIFN